ncbi:MAG: hypothetical protein EOO07_35060 [Chitinophagaceae bacterium]|nr:MAG: hypothetical protein EOO07_35060 [Chitinophagaceae bacterium]
MRAVAVWSGKHIVAARILIAVCHVFIGCSACFVGGALNKYNISIPAQFFWLSLIFFIVILFIKRKSYSSKISLSKRKLWGGLILISSFVMISSSANQKVTSHFSLYNSLQGSFAETKVLPTEKVTRPSYKEVRKQFKELRIAMREGRASAGVIVVVILLSILLGFLLLAASCSLACNGQEVLAYILLFGGLAAIFFIGRLLIRSSKRNAVQI